MSAEYRPVTAISFRAIDTRLEKYGIKVDMSDAITTLVGPHGTLFARPEGNSTHFERRLGVDTQAILDAIEREYSVVIVDENDHRFWGFTSHDQMVAEFKDPSRSWPVNRSILIEGPSIGDGDFTAAWLAAAVQADGALRAYFKVDSNSQESLPRPVIRTLTKIVPCAVAFLHMWLEEKGVYTIDLFDTKYADIVPIMAVAGFFKRTGERYQMTIPQRVNLVIICDALVRLAENAEKDGLWQPENLLVTLTREEAGRWKGRLLAMDCPQRLADREILRET